MMKGYKTYAQAPENLIFEGIQPEWVYLVVDVAPTQQALFESAGFTVVSEEAFEDYAELYQAAFDSWYDTFSANQSDQELRIYDYVDDKFAGYPPEKIDFRRHLQANYYLQKNVIMLPNGRPEKSVYSYGGTPVAEIAFTFTVNAFNFMIRRIEKLSYYRRNGTLSEQWVIADDVYDPANPYHLREMMKERSEARMLIIEEVKAFLNGVLASYYIPLGYTYPQILGIAGDFWTAYGNDIAGWTNVGSPAFATSVTNDTDFAFLDATVAPGVTARQYILNKISY